MNTTSTAPTPRACAHCTAPLPEDAHPLRRYCDSRCASKARYWSDPEKARSRRREGYQRMDPEERAEINRRSNTRRFKQDLLPRIRLLSKMPAEFIPGSEDALFAVRVFLVMAMKDWKIQHAIQFKAARDALAVMAGGHEALEAIEEEANEYAIAKTERIIKESKAAA